MIELKHVYKAYKNQSVLNDINLEIQGGEFFVLIGSSGCGKTTLLNKLNTITKGEIRIDGVNVKEIKEADLPKMIGYVVQESGLFPHLTVAENIELSLKLSKYPKDQIEIRRNEMMEMVELDPMIYGNKYPSQLSGGQRQRVNIARAFAADPPIMNYVSDDYISVFTDTTLQKIISTIDYNLSGIIPVVDHENVVQGFLTKGRFLAVLSRQYTQEGSADERSGIIE